MSSSKKTVIVAGLGRLGVSLCDKLSEMQQYVIGVERNASRVKEMADRIDICAQMDATDEDALVRIGAKEADIAVVTIGENIEASIMATTILKGYNIPYLVARAQNSLHARILAKLGANRVIFPEKEIGERVAEQIVDPWLTDFSQLPGSGFLIGEISPVKEMIGRSLVDLHFRSEYNATVILIRKNGKYLLPGPDTVIDGKDKLLLAGYKGNMRKWIKDK